MATRLTALPSLEPDPLEPRPDEVERYVEALQGLSKANADLARRVAWNQIRLAGARAGRHPAEAHDTLNRIFRLGVPPDPPLDGPTRGLMVTPILARALDLGLRALATSWVPWTGKRFDAASGTGDNLLVASSRGPARVMWPSYRLEPLGDGYAAFRFRTYVSPGTVDPDRETLKIDYDSDENPRFLIRDILDELVQVVRGAYLGKVLLRRKGEWRLIGYFALEPAAVTPAPEAAEALGEPAAATV
ncbi:MAG TPA: hypothetical protein VKG89_04365 [Solirubrobacterales bacterium]|nr:hypothetical protein [Solirubrobacterales bacterium]